MERWDITIEAPMGAIAARLELRRTEAGLEGRMTGKGGDGPMEEIAAEGDRLRWSCRITRPMPMVLKFDGRRDGDRMEGRVCFGVFAKGRFTAQRQGASEPV